MVSQPLPETDENYHNHNVAYYHRVPVNDYKRVRLQFSRSVWCSQDLCTFVKCHTALCCARCLQVLFATVHLCVYLVGEMSTHWLEHCWKLLSSTQVWRWATELVLFMILNPLVWHVTPTAATEVLLSAALYMHHWVDLSTQVISQAKRLLKVTFGLGKWYWCMCAHACVLIYRIIQYIVNTWWTLKWVHLTLALLNYIQDILTKIYTSVVLAWHNLGLLIPGRLVFLLNHLT